eukprot:6197936-Prymnesium_polylepis.1
MLGALRGSVVARGAFEQLGADEIAIISAANGTALSEQTARSEHTSSARAHARTAAVHTHPHTHTRTVCRAPFAHTDAPRA